MNAVENALRHIEKLMARRASPQPSPRRKTLISKPRPPKRKPAKRKAKSARKTDQKKPVVTPTREAYQPPVTHPDVTELEQTFAPAPTPPESEGPITPAYAPRGDSPPPSEPEAPISERPVTRPSWADAFERNQLRTAIDARNAELNVPNAAAPRVARANCKAIDVRTGLTCKLGAHAGDEHGHERGRFHLVAAPGQHVRRAVDEAAWGTQEVSL